MNDKELNKGMTNQKPEITILTISDITKFGYFMKGVAPTTGKEYEGYSIKFHVNESVAGQVFIPRKFIWVKSDNKTATIGIPSHFRYNIKLYNTQTKETGTENISATQFKILVNEKINFLNTL